MVSLGRIISRAMMLAICVLVLLVARIGNAEVVLNTAIGATFKTTGAYSPQLASKANFAPITGPAYFAGDLCFNGIDATAFRPGSVIFYARVDCEQGIPLQKLVPLSSKIGAAVELYGSTEAIIDRTSFDPDPNDTPPRFSIDPFPAKQNLIYVRVHGSDSGKVARFLFNETAGVNATVSFAPDPWKAMYYTPQWIIHETIVILFFCVYITEHAIRSLFMIFRARWKMPLHARPRGIDLQLTMMMAALCLGFVRIVEYSTQTLRDYGDVWAPEIISQLAWGYGYMILLLSMLLLVLYWGDVLKTSKVRMVMIEKVSTRFFVVVGIVSFIALTIFISLNVYRVPGASFVRAAGFLLMGSVALLESVGTMIYGGKLLKQLTDMKPVAQRGGSFYRPTSPSITTSPEMMRDMTSENPNFDPGMNSSTLSPPPPSPPPTTASTSESNDKPLFTLSRLPSAKTLTTGEDSEDRRKLKIAQRRAKPMTRLVFVSAFFLFLATCISVAATFSSLLSSPDTYIVIFSTLAACEITIYALIIQTMSPIWQARRRRLAEKRSSQSQSQLSPLSEDDTITIDKPRCGLYTRLRECLSFWCVY